MMKYDEQLLHLLVLIFEKAQAPVRCMSPTSPSRAKAGEKKEDGDHKPPLNPAVLQQVKVLLRHIDAIDTTNAVELAVKIFETRDAARKRLLQVYYSCVINSCVSI